MKVTRLMFITVLVVAGIFTPELIARANPIFFALNFTQPAVATYPNVPMRVQYSHTTTGTAAARTNALPSANTAGNFLVVVCSSNTTTDTLSVSDTRTNTYASVTSTTQTGLGKLQMFYAANIAAGANTVTCNSTGSAAVDVTVAEYKNVATATPVDVSAVAHNSTANSAITVTTTQARDLLIKATWVNTAINSTDSKMWANDASNHQFEDRIAVTATGYTVTDTFAAQNWMTIGAAFKSNGGTYTSQSFYVIGGYDNLGNTLTSVLKSDDSGATWMRISDLPAPREDHCNLSYNNAMWVLGGMDGSAVQSTVYKSTDGGLTWSSVGNLPGVRDGAACVVYNNKMWFIAGTTNDGPGGVQNNVWSSTDGVTWTSVGTYPLSVYHHNATVFNGKIWGAVGTNSSGTWPDVYWTTDGITWTAAADLPNGGDNGARLITFNNNIWSFGGSNHPVSVFQCGDPCNSWSAATDLPAGNAYFPAVSLNGKVITMPGNVGTTIYQTSDFNTWTGVFDFSSTPFNPYYHGWSYGMVGP